MPVPLASGPNRKYCLSDDSFSRRFSTRHVIYVTSCKEQFQSDAGSLVNPISVLLPRSSMREDRVRCEWRKRRRLAKAGTSAGAMHRRKRGRDCDPQCCQYARGRTVPDVPGNRLSRKTRRSASPARQIECVTCGVSATKVTITGTSLRTDAHVDMRRSQR